MIKYLRAQNAPSTVSTGILNRVEKWSKTNYIANYPLLNSLYELHIQIHLFYMLRMHFTAL